MSHREREGLFATTLQQEPATHVKLYGGILASLALGKDRMIAAGNSGF
jgi:hypothetical protein